MFTAQRHYIRSVLAGDRCLSPATVFDAMSARVAAAVGYRLGVLSGSVCAAVELAAPDLALQTLTEFADEVRRIMRDSELALMVDADHGYGNALNVRRTVQELEAAGAAGLTIEDTLLPQAFGEAKPQLISLDEGKG